ncbi:MAG: hypothetical protein F6K17_38200, partial [Okeania sp. SIO3C4]|nr:hypothetical protein [Okeania sp. SIO3C4]
MTGVKELMSFWNDHSAMSDDRLPRADAFTPFSLRPWIGRISVYQYEPEINDFRIRLDGTKTVEMTGQDWTGHTVNALDRYFDTDVGEIL